MTLNPARHVARGEGFDPLFPPTSNCMTAWDRIFHSRPRVVRGHAVDFVNCMDCLTAWTGARQQDEVGDDRRGPPSRLIEKKPTRESQ
jgi:hypothetical protein